MYSHGTLGIQGVYLRLDNLPLGVFTDGGTIMTIGKIRLCMKILQLVNGTKDGITFKDYQKYKNMVRFLTPYSVKKWLEAFEEKTI